MPIVRTPAASIPDPGTASRRRFLAVAATLTAARGLGVGRASLVQAKDYGSRGEALADLDRLAVTCEQRLVVLGQERPNARILVSRFLEALARHQARRNEARERFGLAPSAKAVGDPEVLEGGLPELRQALDDLMIGYAETLPAYADAEVVSRLAVDMVEVSRLRTVIDLWIVAEEA